MLKQDDSSENERLLLSATFTTKFELFFVLTKEDALSLKYFEVNRKGIRSSKNRNKDFTNRPQFERSTCFYATTTGNFEHFQYFNLGTNFLKNENLFQKSGAPIFN